MIHGSGERHGRRIKRLNLIGSELILFQPEREIDHVVVRRSRVRRNKVGNEVLLFTRSFRILIKQLLEAIVSPNARFHHLIKRTVFGVLGRNFEVAAHVVRDEFLHVLGRLDGEVVSKT